MLAYLNLKKIILITLLAFTVGAILTGLRYQFKVDSNVHAQEKYFQEHSSKAYLSIQRALQVELERLESLAMVFKLSDNVSREVFEQYAQVLLAADNGVHSLEWVEVVKHQHRPAFEAAERAAGYDFEIHDFKNGSLVKAADAPIYAVIKHVYPFEENAVVWGLNVYSAEVSNTSLTAIERLKKTVASRPFKLIEASKNGDSIIIYQPVYQKNGAIKGYVALILNIKKFLSFVSKASMLEPRLQYSLRDLDDKEQPFAVLGPDFSTSQPFNMRTLTFDINIATRTWQLTTHADVTHISEYQLNHFLGQQKSIWIGLGLSLLFALFIYFILKFSLEKNRNKRHLQAQEVRYKDLIEQASDIFYMLNCKGDLLYVNSQAVKSLGYSRSELLSMNIQQIDAELTPDKIQDTVISFQNNPKRLFESDHRCKDGTILPVEISFSKFIFEGEYVCSAFVRDLTDRIAKKKLILDNTEMQLALQKYNNDLQEQKLAFETVFEKSADGLVISEGRHILSCNEATVNIFGYVSKEDFLRLPNHVFSPKYQPDGERSHRKGFRMLQICLEKGNHRYEWVNKRANGEKFWADVVLTRIEYYGRPVIHIAFRDISKSKQLAMEMVAAKDSALQAYQIKSAFLARMFHEIHTPLHGILSYAQMGEKRVETADLEKLKRFFANIEMSAQRLLRLFEDLFDSSKLEAGVMRYEFSYQDLRPVVTNCIKEQAVLASDKQIEVILVGHVQMAYFDASRIAQVLTNLLSNAIRVTPAYKTIWVKIEQLNINEVQVTVADEGPGILEDELTDIFEQFVQSRQNIPNTGGTGLGLAISREIISGHGGKVWAENRLKFGQLEGADFKFILPIHKRGWSLSKGSKEKAE
jgi:PAS domain S-box-containing protein